MLYIIDQVC